MSDWKRTFLLVMLPAVFPWATPLAMEIRDDFDGANSLWEGGLVSGGEMTLEVTGDRLHHGGLLLLKPALTLPADDWTFLDIRFRLLEMSERDGRDDFVSSARIFLMPEPLPDFVEPYSTPFALLLYVQRQRDGELQLTFYEKNGGSGFGRIRFQGVLSDLELPLEIRLCVSQGIYRILFDRDVLTDVGSLSGHLSLPPERWSGPVRFGIRAVNGGDAMHAQVMIDDLTITETTF